MSEESKAKWWRTMIAKHGSEEAVKDFMAISAKKAEHTGTGGFHHMAKNNPEKFKDISSKGGRVGRRIT